MHTVHNILLQGTGESPRIQAVVELKLFGTEKVNREYLSPFCVGVGCL